MGSGSDRRRLPPLPAAQTRRLVMQLALINPISLFKLSIASDACVQLFRNFANTHTKACGQTRRERHVQETVHESGV